MPRLLLLMLYALCAACHAEPLLTMDAPSTSENGTWMVTKHLTPGDPYPNRCSQVTGQSCSIRVVAVSKDWPGMFEENAYVADYQNQWDTCLNKKSNTTMGMVYDCVPANKRSIATGGALAPPQHHPYACLYFSENDRLKSYISTSPIVCVNAMKPQHKCSFDVPSATLTHRGQTGVEMGGAKSSPASLAVTCTNNNTVQVYIPGPEHIPMISGSSTNYATIDLGAGAGKPLVLKPTPNVTEKLQIVSQMYGKYDAGIYSASATVLIAVE